MGKIRKIIPEERNYTVKCACSMCKNTTEVKVRYGDYLLRFAMNKPAQDCFPYLSVPEREAIISGVCLDCQKKLFANNYDKNGNWIGACRLAIQ